MPMLRAPSFKTLLLAALVVVAWVVPVVAQTGMGGPGIALLSVGAPVLLFGVLVGSAALAMRRGAAAGRMAWLAVALVSGVLLLWLLRVPSVADGHPKGKATLRIVAFNLWQANIDPDRAAAWILAQTPDVAVLTETAGAGARIAEQLRAALPYGVTCRTDRPCSTVILSRLPPLRAGGCARGDADNRRALSAAWMELGGADGPIVVAGVHFSRPWPVGAQQREVALLAACLAPFRNDRMIVAGDFNAPRWSTTMHAVSAVLGLRPAGGSPTWPAPSSGYAVPALLDIDHVMIGPLWTAARVERGPALGSDHYPLAASLFLSGGQDGAR